MGQTSRRIYTEQRPNKVRNGVMSHNTPTGAMERVLEEGYDLTHVGVSGRKDGCHE